MVFDKKQTLVLCTFDSDFGMMRDYVYVCVYIYICAVKLLFGPSLAILSIMIWAK